MRFSLIFSIVLLAQNSYSSGFEKAVTWSGRYAGVANAVTSAVEGPQALYFNPAALIKSEGTELTVNFSPSFIQFEGPFAFGNETSDTSFTPPFSIIASTKKRDSAIAMGVMAVGGNASDFGSVDISNEFNSFDPEFKASLSILEFTLGGAHQIAEHLSIGFGWRASFVFGELKFGQFSPGASLFAAQMTELKTQKFDGFRVGMLYSPSDQWGIGLNVRTPVEFKAKGKATGQLETAATGGNFVELSSDEVVASAIFPLAISLGSHYQMTDTMKWFFDVSWLNYEINDNLELSGTLTDSSGTVVVPLSNNALEWEDGIAVRFAGEYQASWPIRFGYAYGSPIASPGNALPFLESPGSGHVFTLGSGTSINEGLQVHFALEYAFVSGEVEAAEATNSLAGDYKTTSYAAHLGLDWKF